MSMDQLMALVPIEAATALSTTTGTGRKSRWERTAVPKGKASRFGNKDDKPYLPPPFVDLPPGLTPLQMDQFLREQRLDDLTNKLEKGELEFGDPDIRPPSPPPVYDKNGSRVNTRDVRVRSAMVSEHQRLLEYVTKTVPGFLPPNDFKPLKKIRKIIIPQDKYPEYNFMGLIIGPRGCNHKRLESESGAQISIRGRGTQKEGKKTDHQTEEEAAMPQHIHIAADTEEQIDKAVSLIEPLLDPSHPMHEEFKKKGLEQLALVNGVQLSKIETRCNLCGATGHLSWECPEQEFQSFKKVEVKCALCGDKGHVTMDCKLAKELSSEQLAEIERKSQGVTVGPQHFGGSGGALRGLAQPPPPPPMKDAMKLDQEYSSFLSELSGNKAAIKYEGLDELPSRRPGIGAISTPPPGATPPQSRMIPPPPPPQATEMAVANHYGMAAGYAYPGMNGTMTMTASGAQGQQATGMMSSYMDPQTWAAMMAYYQNTAGAYGNSAAYGSQTAYGTQAVYGGQTMYAAGSSAASAAQYAAMYPSMMAGMMGYGQQPGSFMVTTPGSTTVPSSSTTTLDSTALPPPSEPVAPPSDVAPPPPGCDSEVPPWQQ